MNILRRPSPFLLVAALLAALLTACFASGPQKALNSLAEALNKNDSAAFLAQLDLKTFAANQIKNLTREDQALSSLDSLGRMLGLGGMDDLLGSVLNMENRLQSQYTRGVSTGEMMAQCREAQTPDCPWVPESLKQAQVTELSDTAAVGKGTTPAKKTRRLGLRKKGGRWVGGGQAGGWRGGRRWGWPADGTGRTRPCIAAECATMVGPSPFLTVVACGDRGMFDALGPLV